VIKHDRGKKNEKTINTFIHYRQQKKLCASLTSTTKRRRTKTDIEEQYAQ